MIEKALYSLLIDSAEVRNVVDGRIYANQAPQGAEGALIVLRPISRSRDNTLENEIGIVESIVQVDCYQQSPSLAFALFETVRSRLSLYRGDAGDLFINSARIISEDAFTEEPEDASDQWIHGYRADFAIFHSQPQPTHV